MASQSAVMALVLVLVVGATVVVDSNGVAPTADLAVSVEDAERARVDSSRLAGAATDSRSLGPTGTTLGSQATPTPIDSCRVIDQPGEYVLTDDIVSDPATTPAGFACLRVTVDTRDHVVVIDGDGYALRSSGREDVGISVGEAGTTVVADLELSGWGLAVEALDSVGTRPGRGVVDGVELSNVVATDNGNVVAANNARVVVVEDSEFSNNGLGLGTEQTAIELRRVTVTDSDLSGITGAQTTGVIEDSEFSRNGRDGIYFAISGPFEFRDLVVADNGETGVGLAETYEVTLVDSDLTGNGEEGLRLSGVGLNSRFESNTISENAVGVLFDRTDLSFTRNRLENNADAGIVVEDVGTVAVYDNLFSNDVNVRLAPVPPFASVPVVTWSVDPQSKLNVVDGAFVAGNFYGSPDGDGFSQTCLDEDVDTLCDDPLELFEGNVDEHPLAEPAVPADEPPTQVAPADLREVRFALDCGPLTGGQSIEFGYYPLGEAGIPPDAASEEWSNADVLDVVFDSPLGPAVKLVGVDETALLWTADPDRQVVRVFAATRVGLRSCTCTVVE